MTRGDVHHAQVDLWCTQLRNRRKELGLTQLQVATRVGVGKSLLRNWEGGIHHPSARNLGAWAEALGFELLLTPNNDKEINT